jgi:divalent metal cation (Fe/Co/Zn/Cd) transporter
MVNKYFPDFSVETFIEMNPIGGEESLGDTIINLLHSIIMDFPEIIKCSDLNVFRIKQEVFVSLTVIVDEDLTLEEAHEGITQFEENVKKEIRKVKRIITHIESAKKEKKIESKELHCKTISEENKETIVSEIKKILKQDPHAKGFHGIEFWTTSNMCVLEIHIFFDGSINISKIHKYVTQLEHKIKESLNIENLEKLIIHSEPVQVRTNGELF